MSSPATALAPTRRVLAPAERVAAEIERIVGLEACWEHDGLNAFRRWVTADIEGPPPLVGDPDTSLNCWEMILLAAHQAGVVNWEWVKQLYAVTGDEPLGAEVPRRLLPAVAQLYEPNDGPGPKPQRGDLVFWDDGYHMAVATGSANGFGQHRVYSFWPPPEQEAIDGVVDRVKVTTIEAVTTSMNFTVPPQLSCIFCIRHREVPARFYAPPWQHVAAGRHL